MSAGQIIVAVAVSAFFVYEVYALIRDIRKKKQAMKALENEKKDEKAVQQNETKEA